jgi:hypothetical protein
MHAVSAVRLARNVGGHLDAKCATSKTSDARRVAAGSLKEYCSGSANVTSAMCVVSGVALASIVGQCSYTACDATDV